ncbi:MAG: OSCP/delta subunit of ATPase [Piptocephalis tieghemiana]|nr:MAG: OSCP/delta subunit of ATPase [Piptocephalis tieghemiana]
MLRQSFLAASKTAVRSYATAASKSSVQPPVILHGIDGRYATALYTAAAKKSALDTVESDLNKLTGTLEKDAALQQFINNPSINRSLKLEGVKQIAQKSKWSDITSNFFNVLAENGRLADTPKIISSYHTLMGAHRGEVVVTVTSAKPLDAADEKQIKSILAKSSLASSNGKSLRIESEINPALIGGLLIEFGDKTIDLTVSSRITKLNKLLTDSV